MGVAVADGRSMLCLILGRRWIVGRYRLRLRTSLLWVVAVTI